MRFTAAYLAFALLGLGGCASSPESIPPSYVSGEPYQSLTCLQLSDVKYNVGNELFDASRQQRQARLNDAFGVSTILLPLASINGGNISRQVAYLKGKQEAVQTVMI